MFITYLIASNHGRKKDFNDLIHLAIPYYVLYAFDIIHLWSVK